MSFNAEEIFAKINARLAKINPAEREVEHIYKIKVCIGGEEKVFMLDLKNVKFYKGDEEAECTLSCDGETFLELTKKTLDPKIAFEQGKLKIDGELKVAMKLLPYLATL